MLCMVIANPKPMQLQWQLGMVWACLVHSLLCSCSSSLCGRLGSLALPQPSFQPSDELSRGQHFSLHSSTFPLQLCSHLEPHCCHARHDQATLWPAVLTSHNLICCVACRVQGQKRASENGSGRTDLRWSWVRTSNP